MLYGASFEMNSEALPVFRVPVSSDEEVCHGRYYQGDRILRHGQQDIQS